MNNYELILAETNKKDEEFSIEVEYSSAWARINGKGTTPVRVAHDLIRIKDAVTSLLRVHEVQPDFQLKLADPGVEGALGSTYFEDNVLFKNPTVIIDKNIYENFPVEDILDLYCGVGLHEGSHVKHTRLFHNYARRLKDKELIWYNLLEDERIEYFARLESPGFVPYIAKLKKVVEKGSYWSNTKENWEELSDMDKVTHLFFGFIRYPYLLEDRMKEWELFPGVIPYEDIQKVVKEFPYKESQVRDYALEVQKLWDKYFRRKASEEKAGAEEKAKKELAKSKGVDESAIDCTSKEFRDKANQLQKQTETSKNEKEDYDHSRSHDKEASMKKRERENRFSDAEMRKDMEITDAKVVPLTEEESAEVEKCINERVSFEEDWVVPGYGAEDRKTVVVHPMAGTEEKNRYNLMRRKVQSHVSKMRSIFQFRLGHKIYRDNELIEGKIHRRKLARAGFDTRVYTKSYTKTAKGIAICLVLDESGSMGDSNIPNSKANSALKLGIMMAEALKNQPGVELEIYSYTSIGDRHEDCFIKYLYGKNNPNIEALGAYTYGSQNYDHVALRTAGKLFIENTINTNRMMIVLSDGHPSGTSYGGPPAIKATAEEVKKLKRKGIYVLNVAIQDYSSEEIFEHVVKYTDINEFLGNMRKLITRVIRRLTES